MVAGRDGRRVRRRRKRCRIRWNVVAKRVIGHHLIVMLYGHWLPNDLRGSGSNEFIDEKFAPLGEIHHGRKPEHLQPSRGELRAFHARAEPLLNFPLIWMDQAKSQAASAALGEVVRGRKYTCWACAVLCNHAHFVIRIHRDDGVAMWEHFAQSVCDRLRLRFPREISAHHPVVSARPYDVYLYTPADVCTRIAYVERNPLRDGFPAQRFDFVTPYNHWPFHNKRPAPR